MSDIDKPPKRRLRKDLEEYRDSSNQFLRDYGAFIAEWGRFEMLLEVKIAQLTGLAPKDASIILGGLSFGSKPPILYSLLTARRKAALIPPIKAVINHARRNALVHGAMTSGMAPARFSFFKREVGDRMKVSQLKFTAAEFSKHLKELQDLNFQAMRALKLWGNDIELYAHEAGLFRPTRKRPQARPRRAKNGKT